MQETIGLIHKITCPIRSSLHRLIIDRFHNAALLSPFNIFKTNALVKNLAVCNSDVILLVAFMGERLSCKFNLHVDPPHYQWEKNMSCRDSICR